MSKPFTYIKGASLEDIVDFVLDSDEGSITRDYHFQRRPNRIWILRQLILDPAFRYLECFEFRPKGKAGWEVRGWSEDESIPFFDCPLELLSLANGAADDFWRDSVFRKCADSFDIPPGSWLHSTTGLKADNRACHDFQFLGEGVFQSPQGGTFTLTHDMVYRVLLEGAGIALGRG